MIVGKQAISRWSHALKVELDNVEHPPWSQRHKSMEVYKRLQSNRDSLLEQYVANLDDVYGLQDTLMQIVLPSVADELQLGLEAQEWAKEWLSDTCT